MAERSKASDSSSDLHLKAWVRIWVSLSREAPASLNVVPVVSYGDQHCNHHCIFFSCFFFILYSCMCVAYNIHVGLFCSSELLSFLDDRSH